MNTVECRYRSLEIVRKLLSTVPLLLLGSTPSFAEVTPTDLMQALRGVNGAAVEVIRTPVYDSAGCGVDDDMLRSLVQVHAERNGFRITEQGTARDPILTVSILHFRVKHASDCTASVELTLRTEAEYNGAHLPLNIWSSLALMTVNKETLSRKVGDQVGQEKWAIKWKVC